MSRKGKLPIDIPKGVDVKVAPTEITVKGPKGTLNLDLVSAVLVKAENNQVTVSIAPGYEAQDQYHGLYRTLIHNMVIGTTVGYSVELEMIGVGYRSSVSGHHLDLQIGFSHPTKISIPEGVQVKVDKGTSITITGANKQVVGQFAATVRAARPPEPYQGKGIRYKGEYVRKKAGKAAATAKK